MKGKATSDRNEIYAWLAERLFGLTGGNVAENGIDYDRGFESLWGMALGRDADVVSVRRTGGLLGFFGRLGTRSPGCFLLDEILLQPFGRKTHFGYRISGREGGERGREMGVEKLGYVWELFQYSIRFKSKHDLRVCENG